MKALAQTRASRRPTLIERPRRPIAALPAVSPEMLVPRWRISANVFPFGDPRTRYFYLGRGAVWHAIKRLGLRGEEVLVPAYHHGVEVEAMVDAGAKPRFYGIKRSLTVDLDSLLEQMTPHTRAIYVIHYAGFPQPMEDILYIAREHGLKVIEDCALSLLSFDGVRPLGASGAAAIFCLYKTLPVPHGGALWMPEPLESPRLSRAGVISPGHQVASSLLTWLERSMPGPGGAIRNGFRVSARALRSIRPLPVDAWPVGSRRFVQGQERLGASPVSMHIVRALDLKEIVERRRRNYYALMARLRHLSAPLVQELTMGVNPLFYPFWCDQKRAVQALLREAGVETVDFWSVGSPLVEEGRFPEVEDLRAHILELPIHQDLDAEDIESMAKAVQGAMAVTGQA